MNKVTMRELMRHGLVKTSLDGVLLRRRAARGLEVDYIKGTSRRDVFEQIYASGAWVHSGDQQSRSGAGSDLDMTVAVRGELPALLGRLGATSIVDVGCGDFTWMQHLELGIPYLGVDVAESVVAANQAQFASHSRQFRCIDAVEQPIPEGDIMLCREVLFHLSLDDAKKVLRGVAASTARYLIATSDDTTMFNSDIRTGDFRPLNLRRRPFSLPAPLHTINDAAVQHGRSLGVWDVADLRRAR